MDKSSKTLKINKASEYLGVSQDTLRRWESVGKITPLRTPGGTRIYQLKELERVKNYSKSDFISISEAALKLGVSTKTLRRWDDGGKLTASRNKLGERVYPLSSIQSLLSINNNSDPSSLQEVKNSLSAAKENDQPSSFYFPSSNDIELNFPRKTLDIESFNESSLFETIEDINSERETHHLEKRDLASFEATEIRNFRFITTVILSLISLVLLITASITASYIINPYSTNNFLNRSDSINKSQNISSFILSPFNNLAKEILTIASPKLANQLRFKDPISFSSSELGNDLASSSAVLGLTSSREGVLEINSDTIINGNLTAPNIIYEVIAGDNISITGGQRPIISTDISETLASVTARGATTNSATSFLGGLTASSLNITGALTLSNVLNLGKLSSDPSSATNGATYYNTTTNKFRCYINASWSNCDTNDGGSGDITAVNTGNGLSGGASSGDVTINLDVTTTSTTTTTSANSGLETNSSGLSLLRGCSNGQVLSWDSTDVAWECGAGGGGSFSSFIAAGDSGTSQTITDGNTLTIAGGTNIASVASATDTITLNLDDSITLVGDIAVNGDDITSDGTLTIDAATDINLDADGADVILLDGGVEFGRFTNNSTALEINSAGTLILADTTINLSGGTTTFQVSSTAETILSATNLTPGTSEGNSLGSSTAEWEQLFLGDDNGVSFGLDQDFTLGYDETTDDRLELTTSGNLGFAILSNSVTTSTALALSTTGATTGEALDITGTWAPTDGSDNEAIDINLTHTPTTSADTFRGLDLNVTEGANALANTLYSLKVTSDNSANTSTGTHTIYGGHFSATGKSAGTTTAFGLYSAATGADTNYSIGLDGNLFFEEGSNDLILAVTAPSGASRTVTIPAVSADDNFCLSTLANCAGGATTTLQQAYNNDANGSDATISLTTDDDSLVFTNPTSSGTDSDFVLYINQAHTTDTLSALDITQASSAFDAVNITANSLDTENIIDISGTGLTTGTAIKFTGSSSTGVQNGVFELTSDVGSGGSLIELNPDFSGSAVTGYGLNITATDATGNANTDYGIYNSLALTGNAAKVGIGDYQTVTSSSTTGDTLVAFDAASTVTGIIGGATTRSVYGARLQPTAGAESTAGTTNVYGTYINATGDVGVGGTFNAYGAYVANGTYDTDGTSTAYGVYIEDISGADLNIDLNFTGSPIVRIGDAGVLTFTEAGGNNTLCTITDSSNVGNLACTGNITGSTSGTVGYWSRSSTTLSPATANDIVSIANTTTSGADFAITNTGVYTGTGIVNITANSANSGDILILSSTGLTTGTALTLTGPSSTGVTDHFVKVTSDVGSAASLLNLNPDFSGSAVSGYGIYQTATDATGNANTDYGIYNSLALTGNAAKVGIGDYSTVTSSSTTGDTLVALDLATSVTGIIGGATTRNVYGVRIQPTAGAESSAGTTNVYGAYINASGDVGAGGTINAYGAYIANGTYDSDGTSTATGLYVETISGTDNNYTAIFAGGNVGIGDTTPGATLEVGNGTDTLQISSTGDLTFVDADSGSSITGPAGGALTVQAGASQALTLTGNGASTWSTSSGDITLNSGDEIVFADTDTFIIGGHAGDVAYNVISDSGGVPGGANINSDDDLYIEGSLEVDGTLYSDGGIDTAFTAGSVVFAGTSGVLAEDNTNFFWDDSNNTLGLGDATPTEGTLTIASTSNTVPAESITNNTATTLGVSAATGVIDIVSTSLTTGSLVNLELTESALAGGYYLKAWDATAGAAVFTLGEDGNTTITGLEGSTMFTITAGDAAISDGSLSITDDDDAVSLGVTNNTATTVGAAVNTSGLVDISSTSLTTGNLLNLETTTALSSGRVANISSTSTALTSGNLLRLEWVPGSSTTATSADLFQINLGSNGTMSSGNLLNILDSSSSIFSVSEVAMTTSLPSNFTSSGDVSIAYDINFTNPTSSFITSAAPLYLRSGESFNSSNLTLQTYNAGSVVIESASVDSDATTGLLDINANTQTSGHIGLNIDYTIDSGAGAANNHYAQYINVLQNDTDADAFGIWIENDATSVTIAGTNLVDCLICINNNEAQAAAVLSAILIDGDQSTAGAYTKGIDFDTTDITTDIELQNGEIIQNDTDGTITLDDSGGTDLLTISTTSFTVNLSAQTASGQRICQDGADASTGVETIGDCDSGGADIAEFYGSDGSLQPGDLVIPSLREAQSSTTTTGKFTTKAYVAKSNNPYQKELIGVVSTSPFGEVLGEGIFHPSEHPMPIALAGRVPVNVSTENGPILVGDYLTSSSTPGVAMKATQPGPIVGKALEKFDCQSSQTSPSNNNNYSSSEARSLACQGKIIVFINVGYTDPSNLLANLVFDSDGSLMVPSLKVGQLILDENIINSFANLQVQNNQLALNITDVGQKLRDLETKDGQQDTRLASLDSRLLSLDSEVASKSASLADSVASTSAQIDNLAKSIDDLLARYKDSTNSAVILSASEGYNLDSSASARSDTLLNLTPPDSLITQSSAILENLEVKSEATFSGKLLGKEATFQDSFKSLGQSFLGNTTIAGDISINGTFSISNNSINVIGTPLSQCHPEPSQNDDCGGILYLQNSSLANLIDIFNRQVTIDSKGTLEANTLVADQIKLTSLGNTSGQGIILAGDIGVKVFNPNIQTNSIVLITPETLTSQPLVITQKVQNDYFSVEIEETSSKDIRFNYLIIGVQ